MKYFAAIILLIALTCIVPAQTVTTTVEVPPTVTTVQKAPTVASAVTLPPIAVNVVPFSGYKTYTESLMSSSRKIVKNAPFSAEGISESTQILEDGNRISRSHTTKMYRDSEGRFRRENSGSTDGATGFSYSTYGGMWSTYGFRDTISIFDPVAGVSYVLNPTDKTVRRTNIRVVPGKIYSTQATSPALKAEPAKKAAEAKAKKSEKMENDVQVKEKPNVLIAPNISISGNGSGIGFSMGISTGMFTDQANSKTESLGTRSFEGVEAEGSRTVTTIEAGKIGNERAIEITYEKWFSKELDMIVYSRHYDPRFGEQVYKLVNIDRSEPASHLFIVPADFKMIEKIPAAKAFNWIPPSPPKPL